MCPLHNEYLINSIISGFVICGELRSPIYVFEPSSEVKLKSYSIYKNTLIDYGYSGTISEGDLINRLRDTELWDRERDEEMEGLPEQIHELKHSYYKSFTAFKNRSHIKRGIEKGKKRLAELSSQYNLHYQYTAEGYAYAERNKYLIGMSSFYEEGKLKRVFENYEEADSVFLDGIVSSYYSQSIDDEKIRSLCQEEPWLSMWRAGKKTGVFNTPTSLLTKEQRSLIMWSQTFDGVNESPDKPCEEVMRDHDLLDGWFIEQGKKREADAQQKEGADLSKGKDYDHLYVMVENPEDAQKVDRMNSSHSKMLQKRDVNKGK